MEGNLSTFLASAAIASAMSYQTVSRQCIEVVEATINRTIDIFARTIDMLALREWAFLRMEITKPHLNILV